MPNGGHICCHYCTYNTGLFNGKIFDTCDVYGIPASPHVICRMFRKPGQSHTQAREQWRLLEKFEPGVVYEFENALDGNYDYKKRHSTQSFRLL